MIRDRGKKRKGIQGESLPKTLFIDHLSKWLLRRSYYSQSWSGKGNEVEFLKVGLTSVSSLWREIFEVILCVRARARVRVCVCVCICAHVCVCMHVCMYMYVCVWIQAVCVDTSGSPVLWNEHNSVYSCPLTQSPKVIPKAERLLWQVGDFQKWKSAKFPPITLWQRSFARGEKNLNVRLSYRERLSDYSAVDIPGTGELVSYQLSRGGSSCRPMEEGLHWSQGPQNSLCFLEKVKDRNFLNGTACFSSVLYLLFSCFYIFLHLKSRRGCVYLPSASVSSLYTF